MNYNLKYIKFIKKIFLLGAIIGLYFCYLLPIKFVCAASIGESCPPCSKEQGVIQQKRQELQTVLNQQLQKALSQPKLVEETKKAYVYLSILMQDANATCSKDPDSDECKKAAKDLDTAMANLITSNDPILTSEKVRILQNELKRAQQGLAVCQQRQNPGLCKKCAGGIVQADDTQDPGPCHKCQKGELVVDISKDPGICQKCSKDGLVENDDSEDPGICQKCENGSVVSDDSEDPGPCQRCSKGRVATDNSEDPGMCQKCSGGKIINDETEDPGMCQKCSSGRIVPDQSQDPGMCKKCSNGKVVNDNAEDPGICWKCSGGIPIPANDEPCSDGDACTKNDRCVGGECQGVQITSSENPECGRI